MPERPRSDEVEPADSRAVLAARFLTAVQFLTRLPVPRTLPYSHVLLSESARHFPAVGALVGALGAAVLTVALLLFPPAVAVWLAIAATIAATGAFHEDGLADTFDAAGAGGDRARALAIMKDSRIGSFGALALLLRLALEWAALSALLERGVPVALAVWVLAHALSRAVPVALIAVLPYAGDPEHARARPLACRASRATVAVALLWSASAAAAAGLWLGLGQVTAMLAAAVLAAVAMRAMLARWLGGYTGDTLGAAQQLALLALLLAALAAR
ncbi:MAG: adenosylcobinamide-GDP ribazoletransferase [Burkholderiaceae bacterium]|nr:adenosylcobinamide-GDP ribazoletransferase [Burkholderiaceae bacterium]